MSDDLFEEFSRRRSAKAKGEDIVVPDDIFTEYDRAPPEIVKEKGKPTKVIMDMSPQHRIGSGFTERLSSSVPILGPLFDKATAAAGATIQPLMVKPKGLSDIVTGEERPGSQPNWTDRYHANLAMQDEKNRLYGETNPAGAIAADVTGAGMLLGPLSRTALGARMMGMTGN